MLLKKRNGSIEKDEIGSRQMPEEV